MSEERKGVLDDGGEGVVDGAAEVEEAGFDELAGVDAVCFAELVGGHGGGVDVEDGELVVGALFDGVGAVGDEVVERGEHFWGKREG